MAKAKSPAKKTVPKKTVPKRSATKKRASRPRKRVIDQGARSALKALGAVLAEMKSTAPTGLGDKMGAVCAMIDELEVNP